MLTAAEIIRLLDLKPHPEGGHYRQTFRDSLTYASPQTGEDRVGTARAASTAIYFLLARGERSHWHRVDAVEIWHWHAGARRLSSKSPPHPDPASASCSATTLPPANARKASCRPMPGRRRARSAIGLWSAAQWRRASSSRHSSCIAGLGAEELITGFSVKN
jgi:uncharacterized protein